MTFTKAKMFLRENRALLSLVLVPVLLLVGLRGYDVWYARRHPPPKPQPPKTVCCPKPEREKEPWVSIGAGNNRYYTEGGSIIAWSSLEEPALFISEHDVEGKVSVDLYETSVEQLLAYSVYDKDQRRIGPDPDKKKLRRVNSKEYEVPKKKEDPPLRVIVPVKPSGVWYVEVTQNGKRLGYTYLVRSAFGVMAKQTKEQNIYWAQDFKTKRSVGGGEIGLYRLRDKVTELGRADFNDQGIAQTALASDADLAVVKQAGSIALLNFKLGYYYYNGDGDFGYGGYGNDYYGEDSGWGWSGNTGASRYFTFTDRPLYRPGDEIFFKSIIRDDDDGAYAIPGGLARVRIFQGYGQDDPLFDKNIDIDSFGSVSGSFKLPDSARTGYYWLHVSLPNKSGSQTSFQVEFFRKPEYSIDIETPVREVVRGDKTTFTISGNYFSGQPLAGQKVRYRIESSNFWDYDAYARERFRGDEYYYSYWGGGNVESGEAIFGNDGTVSVTVDTAKAPSGKNQVYSFSANFDDGSGNPSFARKNILVYAGEYGIYRTNETYRSYHGIDQELKIPLILVSHRGGEVGGIDLAAKIKRREWVAESVPYQKWPNYREVIEDLPEIRIITNAAGEATVTFTPKKKGSYLITLTGKDKRGNEISKELHEWVTDEKEPVYWDRPREKTNLTLRADKKNYEPGETARVTITSTIPDRDILFSLERAYTRSYQIVSLQGTSASIEVPITEAEMPNIYVNVVSFNDENHDYEILNLPVSAESRRLAVRVTPERAKTGPGDQIVVNVETTDQSGNPMPADVAVWAVDKALFELVDEPRAKIFDAFWRSRYHSARFWHSLQGVQMMGAEKGCFAEDTPVLMADGTSRPIASVQIGDLVATKENEETTELISGKVSGIHKLEVPGYLILNSELKVTPEHRMRVNGAWTDAGNIGIGDELVDSAGKTVRVESLEWQKGKFTVYNLQIEKYHTYFAGGVWVHNDKGGGGSPQARSIFKDTAYWNPSVRTDVTGRAQVAVKLPDNLTTWVFSGVGNTIDTQVGQTTTEVVVTKDVIVRPILPNILRVGDKMIVRALVQNFTDEDHEFDVGLGFDAGSVDEKSHKTVSLPAQKIQEVSWSVTATDEREDAKLTFSAKSKSNARAEDSIVQKIPVRKIGFWEQSAQAGDGPKSFAIKLNPGAETKKTEVALSLAPTVLGTLATSMRYLVHYPYGCVEQTVSSFVPAVIAKQNQALLADSLKDRNLDLIIQKGITRLSSMQQDDGGWAWWYSGGSDPFVTAYVFEYLVEAKRAGFEIPVSLIARAKGYFEREPRKVSRVEDVARAYGKSMYEAKTTSTAFTSFEGLTPDLIAMATLANIRLGDKNPKTNGLDKLVSMVRTQGNAAFWPGGNRVQFGSLDASTALALRALVAGGGDRELAVKASRYLTSHRRDYWSNTFGTSQTIRALLEFSKVTKELAPNFSYQILLDGREIASGKITDAKAEIPEVRIATNRIKKSGSTIEVRKTGAGELYSTVVVKEFLIDPQAIAVNKGLKVSRTYENVKGSNWTIGVGDRVRVRLTVGGLIAPESYGVVEDELPAGLIPINQVFKNEEYGYRESNRYYWGYFDGADGDITQNGIVMSVREVSAGERDYTYLARAVNEGTFLTPPTTAALMYNPEVYGRGEVQTITIAKKSVETSKPDEPAKTFGAKGKRPVQIRVEDALGALLAVLTLFLLYRLSTRKRS